MGWREKAQPSTSFGLVVRVGVAFLATVGVCTLILHATGTVRPWIDDLVVSTTMSTGVLVFHALVWVLRS